MKIICTDNFGRDYPIEHFVAEGLSEKFAIVACDAFNDKFSGPSSQDWYRVVSDDYILGRGMHDAV